MAEDRVNHPDHYTSHPSGIECVEIAEHLGFNLGNALKYVWRHRGKGNPTEDIRKALWYLQREVKSLAHKPPALQEAPASKIRTLIGRVAVHESQVIGEVMVGIVTAAESLLPTKRIAHLLNIQVHLLKYLEQLVQ